MKKLKNQKGFAASDALIAVLIIALFTGIIGTLSYNIYLSNSSIKRMTEATGYITDVFEYVDKMYYDEITTNSLITYCDNNFYEAVARDKNSIAPESIDYNNAKYKIDIDTVKYNQTEGNTDKLDLIKSITMKVSYKLGNRNQEIEITKIKKRENLITPNSPDLSLILLNTSNDEKIFPIKYDNNKWLVTNENDTTWYNYNNGYWAIAIKTVENLEVGQEITIQDQQSNVYIWVPRYAYNSSNITDLKLLFSTSNKYINNQSGYNELTEIDLATYNTTLFTENSQYLTGRWITQANIDVNTDNYFTILNATNYEIKNLEI